MIRDKNGKAAWGFVMSLISSGVWSLCSCFMSVLISPNDIENSGSGFPIDNSEANGAVSLRLRILNVSFGKITWVVG